MTEGSGVMVVAGEEDSPDLTADMLGLARRLSADLGGPVSAVAFGNSLNSLGESLLSRGADKAILVEGDAVQPYQADAWLGDLVGLVRDQAPMAVLVGHTMIGMDLAPRLAFRLDTAVAMGCEDVTVEGGRILLTRQCYGGKALEEISITTTPTVATIKAGTQAPLPTDDSRQGDLVIVPSGVTAAEIRTRIIDRDRAPGDAIRLEEARVVVAGGGGLGGPEGFEAARELARVLGGAVGASRVACDLGWCPPHYQIGLSGKTVAPDLYIAIGISGAGQHMAGCANAKVIVAINSDSDAPIYRFSHFGVVAGCEELIPALTKEIQKLVG